MAVEIVDVAEASGTAGTYNFTAKAYGVIVGLAIGILNGNGYLRVTNAMSLRVISRLSSIRPRENSLRSSMSLKKF